STASSPGPAQSTIAAAVWITCVLPERSRRMRAASPASAGLPIISPAHSIIVSLPITMLSGQSLATARALPAANSRTCASIDKPGRKLSSKSGAMIRTARRAAPESRGAAARWKRGSTACRERRERRRRAEAGAKRPRERFRVLTAREKGREHLPHLVRAARPRHAAAHLGRAAKIPAVPGEVLAHGHEAGEAVEVLAVLGDDRESFFQAHRRLGEKGLVKMRRLDRVFFAKQPGRALGGPADQHAVHAAGDNAPARVAQILHVAVAENQNARAARELHRARDRLPVGRALVTLLEGAA